MRVKRAEKKGRDSEEMARASLSESFDASSARLALELLHSSRDPQSEDLGGPEDSEERVVTVEECRRKPSLCRDVPTSLASVSSEEELRTYSLDSLRKLAKKEGIELGKAPSRDRALQELKRHLGGAAMT